MNLPALSAPLQNALDQIIRLSNSDRQEACRACDAAFVQARAQHDDAAFIEVAILYGLVIDQLGYPDASIQTLYEALQLAQSYHQFSAEARLLNVIGRAVYTRAEYRHAMQAWAHCLEVAELAGDQISWIWAKVGIAQIYDALEDHATAVILLQQAAERGRTLADQILLFNILLNLGVNLFRLQQLDEAGYVYAEALALVAQLAHLDDWGEVLFRTAEVKLAQNQLAAALDDLAQAQTLCEQAHHRWALANIHAVRSQILQQQGLANDAQNELAQGLAYAQSSGSCHIEMRLWQLQAVLAEQNQDDKLALHAMRATQRLQRQINPNQHQHQLSELEDLAGLRPSPGRLLLALANHPLLEHCDPVQLAERLCETALQIFKGCKASYWEYLPERGEFKRVYPYTHAAIQELSGNLLHSLQQGESVVAHQAQRHQQTWQWYDAYLQSQQIEALLMVPLRLNGGLCGVLMIESAQVRNWSSDEVQYAHQLAIIATRALASIEREAFQVDIARLNAKLQQSNNELEARVVERTIELQKAMEHLIESEKLASLGNLVAGFAHELNTPLGNALTASSTLLDKNRELIAQLGVGQLKRTELMHYLDESSSIAELVERNARRASNLIANLKQVAVDTASSKRRFFHLLKAVDDTIGTLSLNLKKRNITIVKQIPAELVLNSYPGSLEQVIANLINNSLIHAFAAEEAGTISIDARLINGEKIEIRYQDNGVGIADHLKKRVFDPFFTTRFGLGGSGLGLYLVYSLVGGTLGGVIELKDAVPRGALFILTLPIEAPAEHHDRINLLRH